MTRAMRLSRKSVVAIATTSMLVLGGGAFAIAQDDSREPTDPPSARPVVQALDNRLISAFSVLQGERLAVDGLPSASVENLKANNTTGVNPSLSRFSRELRGVSYYVVPGDDLVCLDATSSAPQPLRGEGASCSTIEGALAGRVIAMSSTRAGIGVRGLVPDGVDDVRVHLSAGGTVPAEVINNVYITEVKESVSAISFSLDGRESKFATPFELTHVGEERDGEVHRIR